MPARKNNWLNAKPMTRTGGKAGKTRNPKKPYTKPASTSGTPKVQTKTQQLQKASKTQPKSSAPTQPRTRPVTRTGPVKGPVPPKGSSGPITMPNSKRAGVNLPKAGARAERTAQRATQMIKGARTNAATTASSAAKAGAGLAGRMLGAAGVALAIPAAIKNIKDVAERNRRWQEYKKANGMDNSGTRSRRGGAAATRPTPKPTSALQGRVGNANVDELRRGQEDTRKAQLERANRGNGRTQSGGGSTQSRSGGTSRPSAPAPRRQPASAPAAKPRFKGSAEEGRKMWAEKYSSSKYDGQAIQKEAKKLLEEMKKRRESKSSSAKAGWDGNKNY